MSVDQSKPVRLIVSVDEGLSQSKVLESMSTEHGMVVSKYFKYVFPELDGPLEGNKINYLDDTTLTIELEDVKLADNLSLLPNVRRVWPNDYFTVPFERDITGASDGNASDWGLRGLSRLVLDELKLDGSGVKVGVLDSGIDVSQPCFADLDLAEFRTFDLATGVGSAVAAHDSQWHGTHVAALIAGDDNTYLRALAPRCQMYVGQVLQNWIGSPASFKSALIWMRDHVRPHILNLSLGKPGLHDDWADELSALASSGTIICVAAGNEFHQDNKHRSPANYPIDRLLSIGAHAEDGEIWYRSGGGLVTWPQGSLFEDLVAYVPTMAAPGVQVLSATPTGYRPETGSSQAAPIVTGLLAALVSHPKLDSDLALKILMDSFSDVGEIGRDIRYGYGIIDEARFKEAFSRRV